jgi:hypothetical protein
MSKATIAAATAMKFFRGTGIKVRTATPAKREEGAKKSRAFDVKMEPLQEQHILDAAQYPDGKVTIVTVDGQRHTATGKAEASA